MGRFLYFLIMLLLARMLIRGILGFAAASRRQVGSAPSPGPPPGEPVHKGAMVRDPVCGLHVPQSGALSAPGHGDETVTVYFCSDRCRSAYAARS